MERHELVMVERPYWRTILHDGGPGPMIVAVEETSYAEINGRTARKELSVYDSMLAEIMDERNKAKARRVRKPDNRTHAERLADWNAEKDRRKDRRIDAKCNHINKKYGYLCIEQERRISAEKIARADWELEQDSIAEDRYYAELEEEYREWERRYRHEKYMRNLNEWLKYA